MTTTVAAGRPDTAGDAVPTGAAGYDLAAVRAQFPVLSRRLPGDRPLVYLDSAATSQKPRAVLTAMQTYYELHNANVHRGVHTLAEEATALYEGARVTVAAFVGAADPSEIVFTRNATEALNVAAGFARDAGTLRVGPGDEVVVTEMEHHSNLVPWQLLAQRTGARLRWLPLTPQGRLDLSQLSEIVNERTKIVSLTHVSNLLGTITPVATVVARAHEVGALAVVDASQAVPHLPYDVTATGADLIAFTGHKMLGPTGIGVLWGRRELMATLPPVLGGGEMVDEVTMAVSTYAPPPHRFEAGTPPIAEAVGLGAAVDLLTGLGMAAVAAHEREMTGLLLAGLTAMPGIRVIGPDTLVDRGGAVSFVVDGVHPHDVGQVLDSCGVAVRVGHHCAKPACDAMGVPATVRASSSVYTDAADIEALLAGLRDTQRFFGV